ncbi:hypothetical protein KQI52_05160 [bacterium]|nr:hypothetical protein [bacterium]
MLSLTRLKKRSKSDSHRKHRRKHRSRSTQQQIPSLIVDVMQKDAPQIWSLIGVILVTVQGVTILQHPSEATPWMGIGVAALLALVGFATRTLPAPRPHPAFLPALLIVLGMPVMRMLSGKPFMDAFTEPFVYGIILIWMFAWFIRARWAIGVTALILVLGIEYYVTVHLPEMETEFVPLFSHDKGIASLLYHGGVQYRLLLLLVLISLIAVLSQARVERSRWAQQRFMRFLMYTTVFLGTVALIGAMVFPQQVPVDTIALFSFSFGISIASRQRLISEDPTRHPPSQLTPVTGFVEEGLIGTSAIVGTITGGGRVRTGTPENRRSRFIDAKSDVIYNPYTYTEPNWVPVVLHMHSNRWEGKFKPEVVVDHFQRLGAGSVILTDHNRITRAKSPYQNIDAYEHGWGPHNHHILVLGAHKRLVETNLFGGTVRDRGKVLDRLRGVSEFTVLAHPRNKGAWPSDDVTRHDYDAIEVFNRSIDSYRRWDEALSSGLLVWATAGDDCHDIRSRHQTGKRFLMADLGDQAPIPGEPADGQLVLEALKAGRFVSVRHMSRNVTREIPHPNLPKVEAFQFDGENLHIRFNKRVDTLKIYGPFRTKKATLTRESEVSFGPKEGEGFVRVVAEHGPFLIVFNPLARVSGIEYGV